MTVFIFPGQGSQIKGMGEHLFAGFEALVNRADAILGYSVQELCLTDPDNQLNQTQFTQPALYLVNALTWLKKMQDGATSPQFVAGHSLGEYNALFAANVFDFETGLKLVQKRGQLMSQAKKGGMAAVIGLKEAEINQILHDNQLALTIANYNSYTQLVLTGLEDEITRARDIFEKAKARLYIPLKVSGAFHSSLMQEAQDEFAVFLNDFHFNPPEIPVIANLSAKPYQADLIQDTLANQITHSVLWSQSIDYLREKGETEFEELGPGKVLTGILKKIQQNL